MPLVDFRFGIGDHAPMEDFLLRTAAIPLAAAAVAAGLLRLVAGPTRGAAMAGGAICLGFLAGYGLTLGIPAVWPTASSQKVFFIAAAGGIAGLALDLSVESRRLTLPVAVAATTVALAWLGWSRLAIPDWADAVTLAIVAGSGTLALVGLHARSEEPAECAAKLLVASAALAALALLGASASTAQLCGALAAATGGFGLWVWPRPRLRFGASALLGGGLVFVVLAGSAAVFTNAAKPALLLLLPIFFAERALGRHGAGFRRGNRPLKPVLVTAVALIPAVAAVGLAVLLGGSGY
jgi:hypothetical protein